MRIKYTKEILGSMKVFNAITHALLKDCFEVEGALYFVVVEGQAGKAIGKKGMNVKELQRQLNRKVKIVEFNQKPEELVKNMIYPLNVDEVVLEDNVVKLRSNDRQTKGLLMGRNAKNLNMLKGVVKRYFDVDVKVE